MWTYLLLQLKIVETCISFSHDTHHCLMVPIIRLILVTDNIQSYRLPTTSLLNRMRGFGALIPNVKEKRVFNHCGFVQPRDRTYIVDDIKTVVVALGLLVVH